ncbi:uncharacterized protein LOC124258031 [Haliotis rubra]|uniref:uncharacterized protein LOC124258031 n=1 Tax=Haliotis rubra TaxID=36100 RepID=UPI001EE503F7|nr:uncharacterized protein LOC124258031 [Haliotis rubra]
MHPSTKLEPCPELTASRWSKLFFLWSYGLVKKANEETLTEDKVWDINPRDKCCNVCPRFERQLAAGRLKRDSHRCDNDTSRNIQPTSSSNITSSETTRHRKKRKISETETKLPAHNANNERHFYDSHETSSGKGEDHVDSRESITCSSLKAAILKTFWKQFFCAMGLRLLQYCTFWITNPHFMM